MTTTKPADEGLVMLTLGEMLTIRDSLEVPPEYRISPDMYAEIGKLYILKSKIEEAIEEF